MQHAPWTVRSADWPARSKMTLALIAKDIGKSSSYFESLASVRVNRHGESAHTLATRVGGDARGGCLRARTNLARPTGVVAGTRCGWTHVAGHGVQGGDR